MSTPRYFDIYDLPEFDARYGADPAFTRRCDSVAYSLYKLLAAEVRFLRKIMHSSMDGWMWDLCDCANTVVDSIPFDELTTEESCEREAPQIFKVAHRFFEHRLFDLGVCGRIENLIQYVNQGGNAETLGVAS